jgi:hypothetical protein
VSLDSARQVARCSLTRDLEFSRAGFELIEAADGETGVSTATTHRP